MEDMIDKIEAAHSLFLLNLCEPSDNSLRLEVGESTVGEPEDVMIAGRLLKGLSRISHQPTNRVYTLTWNAYVTYAVTNESWANFDDSGPRVGRLLVRFSDSSLLRYHWQVNCENHVVDVVSYAEPTIEIKNAP